MPSVVRIHLPPRSEPRETQDHKQRPDATKIHAGVAQLVELQPSKLVVEGSSPFARSNESPKAPPETPAQPSSSALVAQWQCTSLVRKGSRVQFSPRARLRNPGRQPCRKKSSSATSRTSTSERSGTSITARRR